MKKNTYLFLTIALFMRSYAPLERSISLTSSRELSKLTMVCEQVDGEIPAKNAVFEMKLASFEHSESFDSADLAKFFVSSNTTENPLKSMKLATFKQLDIANFDQLDNASSENFGNKEQFSENTSKNSVQDPIRNDSFNFSLKSCDFLTDSGNCQSSSDKQLENFSECASKKLKND